MKKTVLSLPGVQRMAKALHVIASSPENLNELRVRVGQSRSPALFATEDDFLTERLLAHPAVDPLPTVQLASSPATDVPGRLASAERLLKSYHKAVADEATSPMVRKGEDLWTDLVRKELPELMNILDGNDAERLAGYLMEFGRSYVWFGGITTCVDGFNRDRRPERIALTYYDKLVCLAEYLGLLQFESPEYGPWGANLHEEPDGLVERIETALGISIAPPLGIIHTDGLATGRGIFHYRHINALYCAARLAALNRMKAPVCELGGGLGMTALYARRLGMNDYTLLDLPITCLLAGHYLLHAVGEDHVSLYGEEHRKDTIKVLPYWECLGLPDKHFAVSVNQDSLPEIADNLILEYLTQINRITTDFFLSINHECFYPRTVSRFAAQVGGFETVCRSKCWVREGYLEEVFNIQPRLLREAEGLESHHAAP